MRPFSNFLVWLLAFLPSMMLAAILCAAMIVAPVLLGIWVAGDADVIVWRSVLGGVIGFGGAVGAFIAVITALVEA
jgi:hypothetical protein